MNQPIASHRDDRASPVDLPGDAAPARPLLWASGAIAMAVLYLLLFNAVSLDGWVAEQPPGPIVAPLSDASAAWLDDTRRAGLAEPRDAAHRLWKRAEAARLPGQAPAAP